MIGYPGGQDGAILPARDTGFVPQVYRSCFGVFSHIINPLLTMLARSITHISYCNGKVNGKDKLFNVKNCREWSPNSITIDVQIKFEFRTAGFCEGRKNRKKVDCIY